MFHETRFPTAIARASHGGPERRTDVVVLGSGAEERNARWADSRRSWNAGYGVKSLDDLHAVIAFFEERRGRLIGFRWRDPVDCKSCPPEATPTALDQSIGTGDGTTAAFQLVKTYGSAFNPWTRAIRKPVAGVTQAPTTDYVVDHTTGIVALQPGHIPSLGQPITAGFEFDVPVRVDADRLEINLQGFRHGAIPSIPIVEIRL
jgi:uncharacterized protein (TIGR02217 family)